MAKRNQSILVQDIALSVTKQGDQDYIGLTDMIKARTDSARVADVIKNWIRSRTTLEFLGTWEKIYNPDFKVVEFDHFKSETGIPSFVLSPSQWVETVISLAPNLFYGTTIAELNQEIAATVSKIDGLRVDIDVIVAEIEGGATK